MLYPSEEEWEEWGIFDECHRIFVLHWDEIFDAETPDTWQIRTCNIVTLLEEMIEASHIAEERQSHRGALRSILDEAFPAVRRDAILKAYYPFVLAYLAPWEKKDIGEKQTAEVRRLATVILGNLRGYWANGVGLILRLLREADGGRKKELYEATMNLGIATVGRGRSPSYLRDTLRTTVLRKSDAGFIERIEAMFRGFAEEMRRYECYFWTDGIKKHIADSLPPDIELRVGREGDAPPGNAAEQFFKQATRYNVSLKVIVKACDPEAAWRAADRRIGEVFSGLNLFNVDDRYRLQPTHALVADEAGPATLVGHRRIGTEYLGSYDARQVKAEMLFRVLEGAEEQDKAQISAAIQYHRLALQATSDEARLLNLWIALESLCQVNDGSIIQGVCDLISPCVSVENVQKNLTSLSLYLRFFWGDSNRDRFLDLFPRSGPKNLEPQDLVELLLLPDGDARLGELCGLCAGHPLLLHRLYRARTMTLNEPALISSNLEYTRQNVEWQLKRIYRVRNAIVHTGSGNSLLPQLTQHLHCYLVKAIKSILAEMDRNPDWGIRESLEHRRVLFGHVVSFFKTMPGCEISVKAIMDPHACMEPQQAPFAWPHLPARVQGGDTGGKGRKPPKPEPTASVEGED